MKASAANPSRSNETEVLDPFGYHLKKSSQKSERNELLNGPGEMIVITVVAHSSESTHHGPGDGYTDNYDLEAEAILKVGFLAACRPLGPIHVEMRTRNVSAERVAKQETSSRRS